MIKNTADRISKGITAFRQLSGMQIPSNVAAKAREFAQAAAEVVMEIQKVSLRFQSKDDSLLDHVTKFADAASKSMDLISKGVDRFKALDTFKAPLLSQIVRFVEVVRQTVVLFAQARSHFTLEGLVFVGEFADTAGKVVDLIGKGVDSFRKLDGFVAPRQNRLRRFADAIQRTMLLIAPLALSWSPQALEASSEFADRAGKVVDSLSKGVDFFQKLGKDETDYRDLAGRTQELENAVQQTMNTLGPMTAKWKGFTGTARDFADRSGKVADSLMKSIDFLDKLASSKTPYRLLRSRVTELSNASLQMMNTFGPLTGRWNKTFADQTSLFADAAGKVADSLMKAQDFLDKLNSSKTPFRRLNLRVDELRNRTRHMADSFQSVAPDWKQTAEATTLFADRSRKIAESLGKAQDFFDKLLTSKTNFSALGRRVVQLVSAERSMAEQMKLAVPADYTDTTSTFADRAGKIAETLTKALDFFNALRTSKRPPDPAKAYQLRGALARTLRGYQEALARAGQGVAGLDEEAIALKGQLADAQAKIVRTLSRTFDLMKRLAEYQEPKKANAGLLLSRVVQFLRDSLVEFSTYQQEFRRELDRDGAVLAENIGKAIGGLSRAFDLFTKLEGYTGVQESSIGRFIGDLRTTVRLLRDGLLGTVAPEVLDLAEAFGTKLRPRMDTLGKALDLFLKMQISTDKDGKTSGFTGVSDERIQSFITSLVLLIVRLRDGLLNTIAPEILDLAQAFGEKVGPRMDVLGKTLDIFLKINGDGKEGSGLKHVDPDRIGELVGSLYILLVHWKHLIQGGEFQDRDFGTRSQAFAAIVAVVVDSINKVLDLVGRINDPQSKLGDIGRRIAQAVSGLGALMSLVTPRMNQVQAGIHAGLAGATEEVVRGSNYKQEGTLTWAWAFGILQNMVDRLEGKNGRKVQIRVGFRTLMTDAGAIVDDGAAGLLTSWQTRMTGMVQRAQDAVAGIVRALAAIPTNVSINYGTGSLPPGRAPAGAPPPPSGGGGPNNPARYGASQVSNHNYNIRALRIEKTTDLPKQLQRERAFGADPA